MKGMSGSLIILEPTTPHVYTFRVSYPLVATVLLAGLISFVTIVIMGYTFPPLATDPHQARLVEENQVLRTENKNLKLQADRLGYKVAKLEEISKRISHLIEAD
jgi:hypothetical protein